MAQYECMMILNPAAWETELTASVDGVKKALTDVKAKIEKEDVWGSKKLAYKINGSETGHYILFTLELDGKHIVSLNSLFNLDGNIWRYMFVNLED